MYYVGMKAEELWLRQFQNDVVLVSHNSKTFDAKHFLRTIKSHKLIHLFDSVIGFADSLLLFRNIFPGLKSYSLVNLYENFENTKFKAHNAQKQQLGKHKSLDSH